MTQVFKTQMSEIFKMAWQFIKKNGYSKSEALKVAWMNIKLKKAMKTRVVQFFFIKASTGELRQAFGTTDPHRYEYEAKGGRNGNYAHCVQYWDTEKQGFRMFKDFNLVSVVL